MFKKGPFSGSWQQFPPSLWGARCLRLCTVARWWSKVSHHPVEILIWFLKHLVQRLVSSLPSFFVWCQTASSWDRGKSNHWSSKKISTSLFGLHWTNHGSMYSKYQYIASVLELKCLLMMIDDDDDWTFHIVLQHSTRWPYNHLPTPPDAKLESAGYENIGSRSGINKGYFSVNIFQMSHVGRHLTHCSRSLEQWKQPLAKDFWACG